MGDKINVVKEVRINNCVCKVSFEEECFVMDDMLRRSYFTWYFLSKSESEVRTEDGVGGEFVDSVFSEYGEKVGVEGREEEMVQFLGPLEEAIVFSRRGSGEVNDHVERKVDVRFSKECDYASGEHARSFNNRHAKIANIYEESAQMSSRVNETQCLRQLVINEELSARHKGWAEFDESHQALLSKMSRVEVDRVGAPASLAL
ncbi:hypothetical protein VNO80_01127 [Phaseolus coccineus]|uniref:Uncharacterized protein n=1 Tax=Phaseolus coccineus TaxID=3886 RepID=A0AAN9RRD5_PHACN